MSDSLPLILFAKAPIVGKVKTRLIPDCSAEQAAEIAKLLMEESIRRACESWPGSVYLSVWLDLEHAFFKQMLRQYPIQIVQQCAGDLGEKMRNALATVGYPAAVMGCDAPHTLASTLQRAHDLLLNGQSVIGPSEDGGYYFLGLAIDADALFIDKPWGENQVLNKTLASAESIALTLTLLPELNDVDEWSDLLSAAKQVPSLQSYLQAQNLY